MPCPAALIRSSGAEVRFGKFVGSKPNPILTFKGWISPRQGEFPATLDLGFLAVWIPTMQIGSRGPPETETLEELSGEITGIGIGRVILSGKGCENTN